MTVMETVQETEEFGQDGDGMCGKWWDLELILSEEPMGFADVLSMESRVEVGSRAKNTLKVWPEPRKGGSCRLLGRRYLREGFGKSELRFGRIQSERPNDVLKAFGHIDLELWKLELAKKWLFK